MQSKKHKILLHHVSLGNILWHINTQATFPLLQFPMFYLGPIYPYDLWRGTDLRISFY